MKFLKRLTVKTTGFTSDQLEEIATEESGEHAILRVYGRVVDFTSEKSDLGPYTKFKGEFEGVNLLDGEKSRAYVLILPGVAETAVLTMLASARAKDAKASAQFGIDITVRYFKPRNDKGVKYTFGVNVLGDTPTEDTLSIIGKQFGPIVLLTDQTPKGKKARK